MDQRNNFPRQGTQKSNTWMYSEKISQVLISGCLHTLWNKKKNTLWWSYIHSTSGPLADCWRTATPWWPDDTHALGGTKVGCKAGHWHSARLRLATSEPTLILLPTSVATDVLLHWFGPPTADLKPPRCWPQWHRVGFQASIAGWIVAAGLLCADPPHNYQLSARRPLNINRWLPLLPL